MVLTPSSLPIPFPAHVIHLLGGHLEFLKALRELNLLYQRDVYKAPMERSNEKTFTVNAGLIQKCFFYSG